MSSKKEPKSHGNENATTFNEAKPDAENIGNSAVV
jgi:hypothetical protein